MTQRVRMDMADSGPLGDTAHHPANPMPVDWFALGFSEALECGKERVTTKEITPGRTTMRRYRKREKDQTVRLVFEICTALGTSQGTVIRIADQLRYGTEPVRRCVAQAESDAGYVSDRECQSALQDALRTRFIEN
jgi:hypothetical protein